MKSGVEDLAVWQFAMNLAVDIYKITKVGEFPKDRDFQSQMRRAATSIAFNMSEGYEKGTFRDSMKYYYVAKGSAGELRTQCLLAGRIGYLSRETAGHLASECSMIARMITGLIRATAAREADELKKKKGARGQIN